MKANLNSGVHSYALTRVSHEVWVS